MNNHIRKTNYNFVLFVDEDGGEDILHCEFTTHHGQVKFFVLQYISVIDRQRQTIYRVDTKHNNAHKHLYFRSKKRMVKIILSNDDSQYGELFNQQRDYIKKYFIDIKNNYLNS